MTARPTALARWLPGTATSAHTAARLAVVGAAIFILGVLERQVAGHPAWPVLMVLGGCLVAWCAAGVVHRWATRATHAPGLTEVAAIGAAMCSVPSSVLVLRQYDERALVGSRAVYDGPLFAPLFWTTLLAGALAVTIAVFAVGPLLRGFGVHHGMLRRRALFAAVAAASFVWRVYALLRIAPPRTDGGDPLYYHTQANTVARGLGFIEPLSWIAHGKQVATAVHGPGYTVYLSLFSRLGASTWFDHRMASSLIGSASVLLAMIITRRLAGTAAALIAGVFAALYPNMWTIDGVLFPEGLFIFFCGLTILFAYRWIDHRRTADAVALGLAIGAAALTRGEGVFLIVLLCGPIVWFARRAAPWKRLMGQYAWMVFGCLLLLGPWTVRNLAAFETAVPLSTNGNELHVYSNCDQTYNGKFLGFWLFACQQEIRDPDGDGVVNFEPDGDEAQKAKYWQEVGLDYAKDHAGQLPKVIAARVGRQWELFRPLQNAEFAPIEGRDADWARVALAAYYPLVGLSLVGLRRLRRKGTAVWPMAVQFVAVTLTAAYAYGTIRFRAPAELVLCILAAIGIAPQATRAVAWLAQRVPRWPSAAADSDAEPALEGAPPSSSRARAWRWWPVALVGGVVAAATRGLFLAPGAPMEEGFMLVFPERILKGDVANVDFLHLYGPGSLHILAAVYKVFGTTVDVARAVGLAYDVAIIAALMTVARRWGRVAVAVTGVVGVLVVLTPIGLNPLAWHGAIALALWSLVVVARGGRHSSWLAMLLAGLALSFRPDLIVALGAAHAVGWWLHGRPRAQWWRPAAGFVAGMLPTIVHLFQAGPAAYWRGAVIEPVFTLRGGRTLPRPPSLDNIDGALQWIGERPPPWWPLPAPSASQQLFTWFWLLPLASLAGLALAARWWRRTHSPHHRSMLVVAVFSVGLLTQALQRPDSTHLLWGSVVTLPLAGCWLAEWWGQRPGDGSRGSRLALLMAPVALLFVVLPFYTFRTYTMHVRQSVGAGHGGLPPGLPVTRGEREYRLGDVRAWKGAQAAVDELAQLARPGERLLVGPADLRQTMYSNVMFYFLFPELTPATRYIEMDPGLANQPDSGLADDVASADWLILDRLWSGWIEPNDSIVFGSDLPNQVVEQQFCLVGSYEHDIVRLYRKCAGGGAPGPYEGPYEPEWDYAVEVAVPVPPRPDGTYPPGSPAAP